MRRVLYILAVFILTVAMLEMPVFGMNYSVGLYGGFMPSMGGNLNSSVQASEFQSKNGIDGINKSLSGFDTSPVERLLGATAGLDFKASFSDYFLVRLAGNYTRSVVGGNGKTVYDDTGTAYLLECDYAMTVYDVPLTVGLAIPFWKDVKISFSCGLAFAYGQYQNSFKSSAPLDYKGSFTGWAFPLVLLLQGEYFLAEKTSLSALLSYYNGSTKTLEDGEKSDGSVDFAPIDFTGYRFSFGVAYYFYSI